MPSNCRCRQSRLLAVARPTVYHQGCQESETNFDVMRMLDEGHLKYPFYGSRLLRDWLEEQGYLVNRKRVQRLLRRMGLCAIYPRKNLSRPSGGHPVYPYALWDVVITRPNHVWAADICSVTMAKGFVSLVAIMDWASRRVLAGRLFNTLDHHCCIEALDEALAQYGPPEIFKTDQVAQFTSQAFPQVLKEVGVVISMDGKGRWVDNVFVEWLWRSVKYDEVDLKAHESPQEASQQLAQYFRFYSTEWRHQALKRRTPHAVYFGNVHRPKAA